MPGCRAPRALSYLSWDLQESHLAIQGPARASSYSTVTALSRYSASWWPSLAKEVQQLIVDVQRDWTVENVAQLNVGPSDSALSSKELEKAYRDYLSTLPPMAWATPSLSK